MRDSSEIFIGDAISSAERGSSFMWPDGGRDPSLHSHTFLDSPNTTSATTYKIQLRNYSGDTSRYYTINRTENDASVAYNQRGTSKILLMEVSG